MSKLRHDEFVVIERNNNRCETSVASTKPKDNSSFESGALSKFITGRKKSGSRVKNSGSY